MKITPEHIRKVIKILGNNKNRPKDREGRPGGLIDISKDKREVIVIGDLHGAYDNLVKIVAHDGNDKALEAGKSLVVFIGDGVHNDQTGHMLEMESSLLVLEEMFRLILTYGENILYIRGNHDTFDERLAKSGIQQGKIFREFLLEHRGEEYVESVSDFFESLPLFIIGNGFVITHAGPVRGGCGRDELINAYSDQEICHQLMWNRLHEFRGTPSLKEYDERDIRKMLKALNLPEDLPFIVGHNPMWNTGNLTGIWRDIIGIKNHIIIYTNLQTRAPYLKIHEGEITDVFAIEKERERFYV
ncbi:metallophosphoesterase [Sediminispirochaeta smaragdinae]|jgi:predicted phosphodiesterase|uniref:Metallophosphoesterase n=1 Tax=Sediminispirochaeta smaragdinae (strain DSM 11293 / JCM 15392 / SEBR 4228) TaxID=573413 RepID=E1RCC1_SEDSS|nr:metallophosphoesterase [Sediminispirochaeta smaragdinae]ADK80001.1 metallophosphoesterase [Sediminispirochaeta smaragdinae DSM 11293]